MVIWGDNRTGKTHLAAALCGVWAVDYRLHCLWLPASGCAARLRAGGGHLDPHSEEGRCDVLFLDDITSLINNTFNLDLLQNLLDMRYADERYTVVTSNWSPDKWGEQRGAIWKMMQDSTILEMTNVYTG
jgi:DNA replication protein DnaC